MLSEDMWLWFLTYVETKMVPNLIEQTSLSPSDKSLIKIDGLRSRLGLIHEKALVGIAEKRLRVVDWDTQELLLEHEFPRNIADVRGGIFPGQVFILTQDGGVYAISLNDMRVHVIRNSQGDTKYNKLHLGQECLVLAKGRRTIERFIRVAF